jgi:hypothetical protein
VLKLKKVDKDHHSSPIVEQFYGQIPKKSTTTTPKTNSSSSSIPNKHSKTLFNKNTSKQIRTPHQRTKEAHQ